MIVSIVCEFLANDSINTICFLIMYFNDYLILLIKSATNSLKIGSKHSIQLNQGTLTAFKQS